MNNQIKHYNIYKNKLAIKKLKNGMNIGAMSGKDESSNVTLSLVFKVCAGDENNKTFGYAHLVEHMIFKGGKNFTETELASKINSLGGSTNAFTTQDTTTFLISGPQEHAEAFLLILKECVEGVGTFSVRNACRY